MVEVKKMSWRRLAIGFFADLDQLEAVREELLELGFDPADLCVAGRASLLASVAPGMRKNCVAWNGPDKRSDAIKSFVRAKRNQAVLCGSPLIIETLTGIASSSPAVAMGHHGLPSALRECLGDQVSHGGLALLIDCRTSAQQDQGCRCLLRHSSQSVQTLEFQAAAE